MLTAPYSSALPPPAVVTIQSAILVTTRIHSDNNVEAKQAKKPPTNLYTMTFRHFHETQLCI